MQVDPFYVMSSLIIGRIKNIILFVSSLSSNLVYRSAIDITFF